MVATRDRESLSIRLIPESCLKQGVDPARLTIQSDRAISMISKSVAELLVELEVIRSHSRPHVSEDNPFSDSQFKTLKYGPEFPERFGSIMEAFSFLMKPSESF